MTTLVANAADPKQVERARRVTRDVRALELADLRAVLAEVEGRRTIWRFLTHCGVFESVFSTTVQVYANAGRQDVGHYLMAEIEAADPEALFTMMREHRQRQQRDNASAAAARTPSAQESPS